MTTSITSPGKANDTAAPIAATQSILISSIIDGIRAVCLALKTPENEVNDIFEVLLSYKDKNEQFEWQQDWSKAVSLMGSRKAGQSQVLKLAIALTFLQTSRSQNFSLPLQDVDFIWDIVNDALQSPGLEWIVGSSTDGSITIPLWSNEDGVIRLCFWQPHGEGRNSDPNLDIQRLEPFAQSLTLAGEGTEMSFDKTLVSTGDDSHAFSIKDTKISTRKNNFHILGGYFHQTKVELDASYAKLVCQDLNLNPSLNANAGIQQPSSHTLSTGQDQFTHLGAAEIATAIAALRKWETHQETGQQHSDRGEWEEAIRSYRDAQYICEHSVCLAQSRYRYVTQGTMAKMYRMQGRYKEACACLEHTVFNSPQTFVRVDCAGELAMVYRHLDRLEDSKRAAEDQYKDAIELNLEKFACRAIGNVGRVNFQLYLKSDPKDEVLLKTSIRQLNERIERAQKFGDIVLEAIGYGCLSLCYLEQKDFEKAVQMAQKNYDLASRQHDASKIGFSGAFIGRALLHAGRKDEALEFFNPKSGCPPIIALCKEISGEHRGYIAEMIRAGADLKLRDDEGYSALECAVYNGDEETAIIIEQGLKDQLLREGKDVDVELKQLKYEATLRKGYRDIFQDKLRPVLLDGKNASAHPAATLQTLREAYKVCLADDEEKRTTFDGLKYLRYSEFQHANQLPRSNDGYTHTLSRNEDNQDSPFIIFFSYRWINKDPGQLVKGFSPDDAASTQYNRMLRAIDQFLNLHPDVDRANLCIWLDFACVDQDQQRPGVAALPMNLSQCNAMISLIDEEYYERSWCCIEVLMIQTLREAYGIHMWYEHVIDPNSGNESLRRGASDLKINMAEKKVTFESDRPKLLFLERQTKLLG